MQFIITKNNKKIPFYNARKIVDSNNAPVSIIITFRNSELNMGLQDLKAILSDESKMQEFKTVNESEVLLNSYYQYAKLDEINYKYNCVVSPYIPAVPRRDELTDEQGNVIMPAQEAQNEIPEVTDDLITVTLLKKNDFEKQLEDTKETVNAITVAMAEMMGV